MRGRKPKSRELKLLHGNPGQRSLSSTSPFAAGPIAKPDHLTALEGAEWDRLTMTLASGLNEGSRGMLLIACNAYGQMMAADAMIQQHGMTYQTEGEAGIVIRQRPEVRIRDTARTAYQRALVELGASPASRDRVKALPRHAQSAQDTAIKRIVDGGTGTAEFFT